MLRKVDMRYMVLVVSSLLVAMTASISKAEGFDNVWVFGDSLSDTGNLASVQGDFPAPYFGNRVSNGPVAVEVLAGLMGRTLQPSLHLVGPQQGTNYAVTGATARGARPIDLSAQVGAYQLNNNGIATEDSLFIIFMGGNDIRDARDVDFRTAKKMVNAAASSVISNMQTLIAAGAKTFMVINSVDIGAVPDTALVAKRDHQPLLSLKASWLTVLYNKKLHLKLKQLQSNADIRLIEYDFFSFAANFLNNPAPFNYINVTDACFMSAIPAFHPDCNNGANFDQFLFFDAFHPTAKSHERIGRGLFSLVPDAPVR